MKKFIGILLVFFALQIGAAAQDYSIPAYRATGYKGNVSVTSLGLYWNGLETSHGYMFNDMVYLGAGAGVFFGVIEEFSLATRVFAEFEGYWLHRKSTLTTKVRAGYLRNFRGEGNIFNGELTLGWSWAVGSYGLSLDVGMSALVPTNMVLASVNWPEISLAPVVSLSFEF